MTGEILGPTQLQTVVGDLVRALPHPVEVQFTQQSVVGEDGLLVTCKINENIIEGVKSPTKDPKEVKRAARLALVRAAERHFAGWSLPWGILTGIRPTKIVHRLLDQGLSPQAIQKRLQQDYLLKTAKAELVVDVALRQRPFLLSPADATQLVGVYIGIPFCPSRCNYCSFPSYIGNSPRLIPYLAEIGLEIDELGKALRERNMLVQSIYIGGGTPTVLTAGQLQQLLTRCNEQLVTKVTKEFTVEAGRPDTIDQAKLNAMATAGVNRISINPQSMRQKTLAAIGRSHEPRDVAVAFKLARETGFANINMDIILGLPGETKSDVADTLEAISLLNPDSLTVHALALKRASTLREDLAVIALPDAMEAEGMQAVSWQEARAMGMQPYYLYRQKQIFGNLENLGFAKPGKESIYNIQIMEERQSILAIGAGGASKLVNPADWSLHNLPHPKQPEVYYERWRRDLQQSLELLDKFRLG